MVKYLYTLILLGLASILFMSNRGGRAAAGQTGSTGAPGDDATVCQSCHNGPISVAMKIAVLDNVDTVKLYKPGKEYTVHVKINHTGGTAPTAHGFQIVALKAPLQTNGPDIKTWSVIGNNAKVVNTINGRQYVEHNDRSTSSLFQMKWIAPAAGSGPVSFYTAGNGVNSNSNTSGDGSSRTTLQLNEQTATDIADLPASQIKIFPNPANDKFSILGLEVNQIKRIEIRDLFGKKLFEDTINNVKSNIDISNLNEGVYFVVLFDENQRVIKTNKLVKRNTRA